jgi:hypothetical protein
MAKSRVRFSPTPNPNAGKFTASRPLVEGPRGRSFDSAEEAAGDPVAKRLFQISGVEGVFMVEDFVTVTKSAAAEWSELEPKVRAALAEVL